MKSRIVNLIALLVIMSSQLTKAQPSEQNEQQFTLRYSGQPVMIIETGTEEPGKDYHVNITTCQTGMSALREDIERLGNEFVNRMQEMAFEFSSARCTTTGTTLVSGKDEPHPAAVNSTGGDMFTGEQRHNPGTMENLSVTGATNTGTFEFDGVAYPLMPEEDEEELPLPENANQLFWFMDVYELIPDDPSSLPPAITAKTLTQHGYFRFEGVWYPPMPEEYQKMIF